MINKLTEHLTKSFESCRLKAYPDTNGIWTIGWGHTNNHNFRFASTVLITQEQADNIFLLDMVNAEHIVKDQLSNWENLNENQYGACVDFAYNRGTLKYHDGNPTKIYNFLLAEDYENASKEFQNFTTDVKGHKLLGLVRRRTAEQKLFDTAVAENIDQLMKEISDLAIPAPLDFISEI